jgi:hypothetical protein
MPINVRVVNQILVTFHSRNATNETSNRKKRTEGDWAQHSFKWKPYTVEREFMMRQHEIVSTGGWPRDTSIGAARATGVPKPDAPSIIYTNAQPMRKTSATGW